MQRKNKFSIRVYFHLFNTALMNRCISYAYFNDLLRLVHMFVYLIISLVTVLK